MKLGPDKPLEVEIISREIVYQGWCACEAITFRAPLFDGSSGPVARRDIMKMRHKGQVVAILPYDPVLDVLVLNEEFRIGAYEAGVFPWLLEVSAGYIDGDEAPEVAAARELFEETGLLPQRLVKLGQNMPTAGSNNELVFLYAAMVDATKRTLLNGQAQEQEFIRTHVVPVHEAFAMLDAGELVNAQIQILLHWLARHHEGLRKEWLAS
jgi:ADP-ribose pyrophosphatase